METTILKFLRNSTLELPKKLQNKEWWGEIFSTRYNHIIKPCNGGMPMKPALPIA